MKKNFVPQGVPVIRTNYRIRDGLKVKHTEYALLISNKTWEQMQKRPHVFGLGKTVELRRISMDEFFAYRGISQAPVKVEETEPVYDDLTYKEDYELAKVMVKNGEFSKAKPLLEKAKQFKNSVAINKLLKKINESTTD